MRPCHTLQHWSSKLTFSLPRTIVVSTCSRWMRETKKPGDRRNQIWAPHLASNQRQRLLVPRQSSPSRSRNPRSSCSSTKIQHPRPYREAQRRRNCSKFGVMSNRRPIAVMKARASSLSKSTPSVPPGSHEKALPCDSRRLLVLPAKDLIVVHTRSAQQTALRPSLPAQR
jgi:hypothetical protein